MIQTVMSRVLFTLAMLNGSMALSACSSDAASDAEVTKTGTLSMPLIVTTGTHTYRLSGTLWVAGTTYSYLTLGGDTEVVTTTLPAGEYTSNLYGWALERDDGTGTGNFVPVSATLASTASPDFTIYNGTTTSLTFRFQTNGEFVTVGTGRLNVDIEVVEVPPVCTIFGDDCGAGTWCAPGELTGARVACLPAGSVASGGACTSPRDCASNTSCFDFGSGATCTPLCPPSEFNQPCSAGGTCTRQGIGYGVCTPAAE